MAVPKAAVDEDGDLRRPYGEIGFAGKGLVVALVFHAEPPQKSADTLLRRRSLVSHADVISLRFILVNICMAILQGLRADRLRLAICA
jgi:hypothetical protein